MYQLEQITDDPLQTQTVILPDGNSFQLTLYFMPLQYMWLIRSIVYDDFVLEGINVVDSPNLLYQWKNIIPFGLACFSKDSRDPSLQEDFVSGNSKLYVLTEAEVEEYSEILSG